MATATSASPGSAAVVPRSSGNPLVSWALRLVLLAVVDAAAIFLIYNFFNDGV